MNFKKLAFVVSLLLVGCASHPKPVGTVNSPPPPPAVTVAPVAAPSAAPSAAPVDPLLVSGNGWSFKVPNDDWKFVTGDTLPDGVVAVAQTVTLPARTMLFKDTFSGTTASLAEIVLSSAVKKAGAHTVGKPDTVVINGNSYMHASVATKKLHVETWVLAKNGNGYTLMCGVAGSAESNPKVTEVCKQIASTLQIE